MKKSKCSVGERSEGAGVVSGTKNEVSSPGKGVRGGTSAPPMSPTLDAGLSVNTILICVRHAGRGSILVSFFGERGTNELLNVESVFIGRFPTKDIDKQDEGHRQERSDERAKDKAQEDSYAIQRRNKTMQ